MDNTFPPKNVEQICPNNSKTLTNTVTKMKGEKVQPSGERQREQSKTQKTQINKYAL